MSTDHDAPRTPHTGDIVGEAVGGLSGAATGAAIGSLGGPIGTIIGGIAGAVGGWWSGRAVSEAARTLSEEDAAHYRAHHAARSAATPAGAFDEVLPAYQLGQVAARNPEYHGRNFEHVEPELARGYGASDAGRTRDWREVRDFVRTGFERGLAAPRAEPAPPAGSAPALREPELPGAPGGPAPRAAGFGPGPSDTLGADDEPRRAVGGAGDEAKPLP